MRELSLQEQLLLLCAMPHLEAGGERDRVGTVAQRGLRSVGSSPRQRRKVTSEWMMQRWVSIAPFGWPVVPEV